MKGLDGPTFIAIVIAIAAGIIILWALWSRGLLPWFNVTSESECRNNLFKVCSNEITWDSFKAKYKGCSNYFIGSTKSELDLCLQDPTSYEVNCDTFCATYAGG